MCVRERERERETEWVLCFEKRKSSDQSEWCSLSPLHYSCVVIQLVTVVNLIADCHESLCACRLDIVFISRRSAVVLSVLTCCLRTNSEESVQCLTSRTCNKHMLTSLSFMSISLFSWSEKLWKPRHELLKANFKMNFATLLKKECLFFFVLLWNCWEPTGSGVWNCSCHI